MHKSLSRSAPLVLGAVVCLTAWLGVPLEARADEPTRVIRFDPEAYPPPQTRGSLALTGAAVTLGFYAPAFGASYLWPDSPGAEHLRIPVVGPWMKLFQSGCAADDPNCSTFWVVAGAIFAGIDGLGQAGGVGLMLESLFMTTREPSAATPPSAALPRLRAATPRTPSFSLRPVPYHAGRDGFGLGVVGIF